MDSFNLSAGELLFLCAGMGAKEIYGVKDVYKGTDSVNISDEIHRVRQSLERKGYIESDFDGNSSLRGDLTELLGICIACDKFVAADCRLQEAGTVNTAFYIMKNKAVKSEKTNEEYLLKLVDVDAVSEDVKKIITSGLIDSPSDFEKAHMSQKELNEIKGLIDKQDESGAKTKVEEHLGKQAADVLISALKRESGFYSVTVADFNSKNAKNVMFINSPRGSIRMQPTINGLVGEVEFEGTDIAGINDLLDEYLSGVACGKSEVGK